jgi:hypothetical protein
MRANLEFLVWPVPMLLPASRPQRGAVIWISVLVRTAATGRRARDQEMRAREARPASPCRAFAVAWLLGGCRIGVFIGACRPEKLRVQPALHFQLFGHLAVFDRHTPWSSQSPHRPRCRRGGDSPTRRGHWFCSEPKSRAYDNWGPGLASEG